MRFALRHHWPEYLMEAAGLGLFMVSACAFGTLLEHPASPVHAAVGHPWLRRVFMGLAMGATAIGIIYSPWGKQSGAHINPSITATFFRLGKINPWDALFYVMAQFAGALAGVLLVAAAVGTALSHPAVNYVATLPGSRGAGIAFLAEIVISAGLMFVVLAASNTRQLARWTGVFVGLLVAVYITVEAPLSGMSMNPARSAGSAVPAQVWRVLWIYFTAPPLGMLLAAEGYLRLRRTEPVICAKLHHQNPKRCIFRCGYRASVPG